MKERYPSFVDALRDLDDPLTLVHLFAVLPGEKVRGGGFESREHRINLQHCMHKEAYQLRTILHSHSRPFERKLGILVVMWTFVPSLQSVGIPVSMVGSARRLSLEWQAYIARTHALRRVFVSVKGWYFQAEVSGQAITWLVPHPLAQVSGGRPAFGVLAVCLL